MAISRSDMERQLRNMGGRIGFQEGGIMPRLNQLGSGVSSAEQMLQGINQRLQSAESSLGSGGNQIPAGFGSRPVPEFMQSKPQNLEPLQQADPNSPLLGTFQSRPENTTGLTAAIPPGTTPNLEDLYPNTGVQLNAEPMPRGGYRFGAFENRDIVGIPAASYADGGNVVGGEYDFESARQMYGLGKLVKKVTRTVKKIAKSPIGKAALLYAGTAGLGSLGAGKGFGSLFKLGTYAPSTVGANLGTAFTRFVGGKLAPNLVDEVALTGKQNLFQRALGAFPGGGVGAALTATSLLPLLGLGTGEESEEEAEELIRGSGLDIAAIRANPNQFLGRRFRAEGGSMKEPVAKKTMPLLDMGGKEMDLRAEGGFVPIGRMEKADDVPARLSKNEFVFTADAVRNAGDGDVDKGAEVMYNMMKNLESGGDVSEESQGLKGARKMFQTSQRLEEVL